MTDQARRRLLTAGAGAALLAPFGTLARLLEPTPRQPAGPFYPADLPLDDDSDPTRVAGGSTRPPGATWSRSPNSSRSGGSSRFTRVLWSAASRTSGSGRSPDRMYGGWVTSEIVGPF